TNGESAPLSLRPLRLCGEVCEPTPMLLAVWTQNYDPLQSTVLSPLVAALPIVLLLGLLATGRVSAPWAALVGLVSAVLLAIFVFTPEEAFQSEGPGLAGWTAT